jgi:hypothetical protein
LLLLDASVIVETGGDSEDVVGVTTRVDWVEEVVERGREPVDEVEDWDAVDEVARLLVEDEGRVEGFRVVVGGVSEGCDLAVVVVVGFGPPLALVVGAPGLRTFETRDSIGFCPGVVVVVGRCWRFTRAGSTGGMNMVVRLKDEK